MKLLLVPFLWLLVISNMSEGYSVIDSNIGRKSPPDPPPISEAAKYARYIVHYSDWGILAHTSFQPETNGYPMARVLSMSDGTWSNSSGIPYVYITKKDDGARDLLNKDNRCSMTVSLAESDYCSEKKLDPENPRCPQVVLTGRFHAVNNGTDEYAWSKTALFSRHPEMSFWPKSHKWFIGKMTIEHILLVNDFGGNKYPNVEDYFKANPVPEEINRTFVIS